MIVAMGAITVGVAVLAADFLAGVAVGKLLAWCWA